MHLRDQGWQRVAARGELAGGYRNIGRGEYTAPAHSARGPPSARGDSSARRLDASDGEGGGSGGGGGSVGASPNNSLHGGSSFKSAGSRDAEPIAPRSLPTYVVSAPKPLLARGDFDLQSGRVGELNPGTKVHVLETRPLPDGGKRVRLSLEGQVSPFGWVTAVTKSGQENLQPHLFEVVATRPLLVRADFDTKSRKLGEICHGTLLFVLEARETADGAQRVRFAFPGDGGMSEGGWVTCVTKDGTTNIAEAVQGGGGGGGGGGRRQTPSKAATGGGSDMARAPSQPTARTKQGSTAAAAARWRRPRWVRPTSPRWWRP